MMRETHTPTHGSAHADTHFREGRRITRVEAEVFLPRGFADDAKLVAMKNRLKTALPDDPLFAAIRLNQIVAPKWCNPLKMRPLMVRQIMHREAKRLVAQSFPCKVRVAR